MPLILADAMHLVQDQFLVQSAGTHAVAGAVSFCRSKIPGAIQLDNTDNQIDLAQCKQCRRCIVQAFLTCEWLES